jgi:nucleoside-diphosphate-sugar epimerase
MLPSEKYFMTQTQLEKQTSFEDRDDPILITGAAGFIGSVVVQNLLERGFRNLRCFTRSSISAGRLAGMAEPYPNARVRIVHGNLLSREDCRTAVLDARVIFHLAAGRGEKFVPDAVLNSVVTTRNLLEACVGQTALRRFVNVSSFTVYTNSGKPHSRVLDEQCPVETRPEQRGDAYTFAKVRQDEMVVKFGKEFGIPYILVRPGSVYGSKGTLTNRVGIGTFGLFLHLGGANQIPLSYVDNCADAIVQAGLTPDVDGEVFNVIDDGLPSSRKLLRMYKTNVEAFKSVYVPKPVSYLLCYLWEKYSLSSQGQLPLAFNRKAWRTFWKKTVYSNEKIKNVTGWSQRVPTEEGLRRYFEACRAGGSNA